MRPRLQKERVYPILAALCVAAVVLGARGLGWLQGLELALYDAQLAGLPAAPSTSVVLVEITEADIAEQGHWPISDRRMAELLSAIADGGARVIGLDLYRDLPNPPGESQLRRILRDDARIFAVSKLGGAGERGISGPLVLADSGRVGANDLLPDPRDEAIRRGLYFLDDTEGTVQPSFAWLLAVNALAAEGLAAVPSRDDPRSIVLGSETLRPLETSDGGYADVDAAGYQVLMDYAAAPFPRFTFGEVLAGDIPDGAFRDRIVVVGSNAESLPDVFSVPVGGSRAGLEIHAHAVDQLVRIARGEAVPWRFVSEGLEGFAVVGSSLLACLVVLVLRGRNRLGAAAFLIALLGGLGIIAAASQWAFVEGWWFPAGAPALAWMGSVGLVTAWLSSRERAEREEVMSLFARHVSPELASELWRKRDEFFEGGRPRPERLPATILFADMKGFSARAEAMEPGELMDFVNGFMDVMAREIDRHGGMVDGYLGDGIMADFGVPIRSEGRDAIASDARNAVTCALAMARALKGLNADYRERGLPECAMRIGIDSGVVVAGSLGSTGRLQYTVIGETAVNAQRIESTTAIDHDFKGEPTRILASEATCALLSPDFATEALGEIAVKGKAGAIAVWKILGKRQN